MIRTATIKIIPVKEKGYKQHYWFSYKNDDGFFKYMATFSVKNGIPIMKNHSVGVFHSCFPNIDGTGSVAGMRANYNWKNDTVVKAHGAYFNLDKWSVHDPIEGFLYLLKTRFDYNVNEFVNKEFVMEYDYHSATIRTIKNIEDEQFTTKQLLKL
jgi:hypothetical protein